VFVEYTNVSVQNTTIYFIYIKIVYIKQYIVALTIHYFNVYEVNCCVLD